MEKRHYLRLCTFEVRTEVGRYRRLGSYMDGRIVDLNFATSWYMAQTGEPEPQRMADALVPAGLPDYLRAGLRALHTAEELFLGSGPNPPDWWLLNSPPRGPNGETLVYQDGQARLLDIFGVENQIAGPVACEWEVVGILDARRCFAGYTMRIRAGRQSVLGPYLVTPAELPHPSQLEWIARVNGAEIGRGKTEGAPGADPSLAPGETVATRVLGSAPLRPGDTIELRCERLGVLSIPVVHMSAAVTAP